ncbi:MAG TPA: CoA transferase [Acidimicrobiia bacterium]|nr:CoA transferase [Acidimicrobiia bacterium]
MSGAAASSTGPLDGVRVVELASDHAAWAGKLLGDLGADVIVVEPPGGHPGRSYGPFVDDEPGPERSLTWWYYNTSKRGVVLDLDDPDGAARFRRLAATADIVLEGEPPGRLDAIGLDHRDVRAGRPELIWVAVTPFGRATSRADEPATDLTLLAGGGPVWNCGYDDHTLPPVRGGGNQAFHIASSFAAMSALTALLHREVSGTGQFIDVSMHAAANVTTESGSFDWLVARNTVVRQTGRHALASITQETQVQCADGRYVNTGFPPRHVKDFASLRDWVDECGFRDEFGDIVLLDLAVERGGISLGELREDPLISEIYGAGRSALVFLAEHMTPEEFFVGAQQRGLAVGAVWSPEEAFTNEHVVARGFPVEVDHDDLGRSFAYPGAPFIAPRSPWRISRRAPHVGEHQDEVFDED